uniref:Pre-rRNA-processing protein TSR2 homolog n=1 Tax=Pyramimonas obovata TaxID=1411642 RepID=A0A7S0QX22_9CHLO|mmetsp:Transcript_15977/g.34681  ORF Transcript_15977/g.34681 Transcript_15977/m.34681 type:complete len:238 (+) Transcript_15977:267-980(+)|eukprot:CAMPEP_0118955856 /NCGR_PEP_ID=MMETSP1169-20130426/60628_1 /TAXON_ID=36882 /ORGANISM="Pyramimonas obovata, Strain CCMP722" /LENGTH=237 /DNA_ID=CAMNT_0006903771 /DNA_START=85 /DNA_END=798 /DNA_ORIENTATION=-
MELRSGNTTGVGASTSADTAKPAKIDPRWCLTPQIGETKGDLGPGPHFEKGVKAILKKWTAFRLAVDNGWGGNSSEEKADQVEDDILLWFYNGKGTIYADELEDMLMEAMRVDFNTECEDDSCKEVSLQLTNLYGECARGNYALADELHKAANKGSATKKSVRVKRQRATDGEAVSKQTVEGEDEDSDSSSDESDDEDCPTLTEGMEPIREEPKYEKPEPVVDADGFELVQPRRRKR